MGNKKRALPDETAYYADEAAIPDKSESTETAKAKKVDIESAILEEHSGETAGKSAPKAEETVITKEDNKEKRVYVYIGPSIKGVITCGGVFGGSKKEILSRIEISAKAAGVESLVEKIGRLIIEDKNVAAARDKLREGENSLSIAYKAIAAERKDHKIW